MSALDETSPGISDAPPVERPRLRRWLAALLGLLWPGAGHLYAGEVSRAAVLLLIQLVTLPAVAWLMVERGSGIFAMWAPILAVFLFRIWVLVDGWRAAARGRGMPWSASRRWIVLVVVTFCVWLLEDFSLTTVRSRLARAVRIPSEAMEPTILSGDYLLISPLAAERVTHGTLVAWDAEERGELLQRVIGLPGDTLRMADTTLWRNGQKVSEPYARYAPMNIGTLLEDRRDRYWGPLVVPSDSLFLLGDNRDRSGDSRYFGFAPLDRVVAEPRRVYFSRDPETGKIRWHRIGVDLRRP